ncbi:MAG: Crp/Fnr family transcriptional regulator [Proteobacteria bacterium]|nr:Crp/Fnr family transcriptional regulator [Pseudomonadota bacterium]
MAKGKSGPTGAARSLAKIDLFAALSGAQRAAIEARCRWREFPKGASVIDREAPETDVYFVVAGSVRVVIHSESGREVAFDEMGPGGCVGELAAIDGGPRSASVEALEQTLCAILPRQVFLDVAVTAPAATLALLRRMAAMVRVATERILDLSTLGAHNRVYAEILRLAKPVSGKLVIKPIPVHGDIAARVSTTRETVARVFSELARKNIVVKEGGGLTIAAPARLKAMVREFKTA